METQGETLAALSHFLKASSKAALDRCINVAFASRFEPPSVSALCPLLLARRTQASRR
jgi:hypothetical protein